MNQGQHHTEETRARISASKSGKRFTSEHKEAISKSLTGRRFSEEHKQRISEGLKRAKAAKKAALQAEATAAI